MIENPLPKDSRKSYFIQSTDLFTYIVFLHIHFHKGVGSIHGRMPAAVDGPRVLDWMNRLQPSLNLAASSADPFGIYYHPR